jgi:hypothetical protein
MLGLFMVLPLIGPVYGRFVEPATRWIGLVSGMYNGSTQALLQIPLGWLSDLTKCLSLSWYCCYLRWQCLSPLCPESISAEEPGRIDRKAEHCQHSHGPHVDARVSSVRKPRLLLVSASAVLAVALILGPVVAASGGLAAVFWLTAIWRAAYCCCLPGAQPAMDNHRIEGRIAVWIRRSL